MSPHAQLAATAAAFLLQIGSPKSLPAETAPTPPFLIFDRTPRSLEADLKALQCSQEATIALQRTYETACYRLEEECRVIFETTFSQMYGLYTATEEQGWSETQASIRTAICGKFTDATEQIGNRIIQEVHAAKSRYSSSSTSSSTPSILSTFSHPLLPHQTPAEAAGHFTEEVVGILQKAFETKDTLTRAEVKSLAAVTHLNTKQVSRFSLLSRRRS